MPHAGPARNGGAGLTSGRAGGRGSGASGDVVTLWSSGGAPASTAKCADACEHRGDRGPRGPRGATACGQAATRRTGARDAQGRRASEGHADAAHRTPGASGAHQTPLRCGLVRPTAIGRHSVDAARQTRRRQARTTRDTPRASGAGAMRCGRQALQAPGPCGRALASAERGEGWRRRAGNLLTPLCVLGGHSTGNLQEYQAHKSRRGAPSRSTWTDSDRLRSTRIDSDRLGQVTFAEVGRAPRLGCGPGCAAS